MQQSRLGVGARLNGLRAVALAATMAACVSNPNATRSNDTTLPEAAPTQQRELPEVGAPPPVTVQVDGPRTISRLSEEALFSSGSAELTPAGEQALATVVATLPPTGAVEVHGYTDGVGDAAFNLDLSARRVDAVVAWLAGHGVDPTRLLPTPHGEDGAIDNLEDPGARRVELIYETVAP